MLASAVIVALLDGVFHEQTGWGGGSRAYAVLCCVAAEVACGLPCPARPGAVKVVTADDDVDGPVTRRETSKTKSRVMNGMRESCLGAFLFVPERNKMIFVHSQKRGLVIFVTEPTK